MQYLGLAHRKENAVSYLSGLLLGFILVHRLLVFRGGFDIREDMHMKKKTVQVYLFFLFFVETGKFHFDFVFYFMGLFLIYH